MVTSVAPVNGYDGYFPSTGHKETLPVHNELCKYYYTSKLPASLVRNMISLAAATDVTLAELK